MAFHSNFIIIHEYEEVKAIPMSYPDIGRHIYKLINVLLL